MPILLQAGGTTSIINRQSASTITGFSIGKCINLFVQYYNNDTKIAKSPIVQIS